MSKLKVGIDINEILRARWLQFDRFYVQEYGEDKVPEDQGYVYDFFKEYKWEDTIEVEKELKEPEDMPENINPLEYQVDEKGEADADIFLFKKSVETRLTAKEVYNRFMYEDYVFEIHGSAPPMYRGIEVHLNEFLLKYENVVDFTLLSVENKFSIPSTLFFLSKITARFPSVRFVDKAEDMWDYADVLITTDPELLNAGTPDGGFLTTPHGPLAIEKYIIKLLRPYNEKCQDGALGLAGRQILQLKDLTGYHENEDEGKKRPTTNKGRNLFQKIIKYNPKD